MAAAGSDDGPLTTLGSVYPCELALPESEALVVAGSMASHPADRSLTREQVWPVQIIMGGRAHPAPYFRAIGEFGVSSFAFVDPESASAPIFYCCGKDLWQLDLSLRASRTRRRARDQLRGRARSARQHRHR
jgi:hypothetical protein